MRGWMLMGGVFLKGCMRSGGGNGGGNGGGKGAKLGGGVEVEEKNKKG